MKAAAARAEELGALSGLGIADDRRSIGDVHGPEHRKRREIDQHDRPEQQAPTLAVPRFWMANRPTRMLMPAGSPKARSRG